MVEWLDSEVDSSLDEQVYPLDKAKARYEVRDLCQNGWIVLKWDKEKSWLKFAVLQFCTAEHDPSDTRGYSNIKAYCVFYGDGPSGSLRECRHTYWGEDGYLFYPDGRIIAAAFKALSEFYDDMGET
jgi:hypothetical protein